MSEVENAKLDAAINWYVQKNSAEGVNLDPSELRKGPTDHIEALYKNALGVTRSDWGNAR